MARGRVELRAPGGPDLDGVLAAITATFDRFDVAAGALTAYDPRVDGSGTIAVAGREIAPESPIGPRRR